MDSNWCDRYPYLECVRDVDVRELIEANRIVDTGAAGDVMPPASCFLCDGAASSADAVRLNHGKWVCAACFVELQHTRYPEKYQRVYEEFLVAEEARKRARAALEFDLDAAYPTSHLRARLGACKGWGGAGAVAGVLLGVPVPAVGLPLLGVSVLVLSLLAPTVSRQLRRRQTQIAAAGLAWEERNPEPPPPDLRDFHDPMAELTPRDERLQEIFDYWPGYPPFWSYVKRIVLARDGRCQITGCPSRTEIHVHHRQPLAQGGSHRPDNLVALCAFHHGLQPDVGHERVWLEVSTRFFTMVCAHMRAGVPVRAHVRRRSLATQDELLTILRFHGLSCPECDSDLLRLLVDYHGNKVHVGCGACGSAWAIPQKLTEETGPQLCSQLVPTRNLLSGEVDWGILGSQRRPVAVRHSARRRVNANPRSSAICPLCGSRLKLRNGRHGPFWGCTSYPRCGYTRDHQDDLQRSTKGVSPN